MTGLDSSEAGPSCIFCQIVEGSSAAYVVDEDESTLSFLDINPVTEGHTLVVPKRHSRTILDIDPEDAAAMMRSGVRVSRWLDQRLSPEGFSLFQANEPAGWQEVFHVHLHVIPRWTADPLMPPWRPTVGDPDHLGRVAARLGISHRSAQHQGDAHR